MAKVKNTSNPEFCGIDAGGTQFAHGEAEVVDPRLLAWFGEHDGYEVSKGTKRNAQSEQVTKPE